MADEQLYKDFFLADIEESGSVIKRPYRSNMVRGMTQLGMTFAAYDKAIRTLKKQGYIRETARSLVVTEKGLRYASAAKRRVPMIMLKHFGSI